MDGTYENTYVCSKLSSDIFDGLLYLKFVHVSENESAISDALKLEVANTELLSYQS